MAGGWRSAATGAALIALAGCAGSSGSLEGAKEACKRGLQRLTHAGACDRYVTAAVQSKDANQIYSAYAYRALLREFTEDLPGALADAEKAIAALPGATVGHRRRAAIIGESGQYEQALKLFADFAPMNPTHSFDENIAMLHYVAGERAKAVGLFQSAAVDYAENDRDENMAAILRFTAAVIESELQQGDLAPIRAQDVSSYPDTMLPLLKQHRLGEISDAELLDRTGRMTGPVARSNRCEAFFSVGHRNAVAGKADAAKAGLQKAVAECAVVTFEHHAAKAWLKQLGG